MKKIIQKNNIESQKKLKRLFQSDIMAQFNLSLLFALIGFIIVIIFIFVIMADVNLSISVNDTVFEEGTNIILFYEISNDHFFGDATNVELDYAILDIRNFVETNETIDIGVIKSRSNIVNNIILNTANLERGSYTIWTHLDYWIYGKWETKHLSLTFKID